MRHIKQMQINVQALNACLGIDGPDWIEVDDSEPTGHIPPICAHMERTQEWKKNIAKANTGKTHMRGKCVKTWEIIFEDGRKELVKDGLIRWCERNGYSWSKIRDVSRGKAKKSSDIVTVRELGRGSWQIPQEAL